MAVTSLSLYYFIIIFYRKMSTVDDGLVGLINNCKIATNDSTEIYDYTCTLAIKEELITLASIPDYPSIAILFHMCYYFIAILSTFGNALVSYIICETI